MTQTYTAGQTLTAEAVNAELAFPTGAMLPYAGASAPTQTIGGVAAWLLCDGTAVSRTTYADLFALIGTTYGTGNGSTTFNLPDLRGRVPLGAGTGAQNGGTGTGAISGGTSLTARTRGAFGGDERLQSHTHEYRDTNNNNLVGGRFSGALNAGATIRVLIENGEDKVYANTTTGAGSGQNMPPFIVTNYLIKT